MDIKINNKVIGDGHPVFVVAEMAWGHDGAVNKGKTIIDGAADGGADAINIHVTNVEDYMVPYYGSGPGRVSAGKDTMPVFDYHQKLNLSFEQFGELFDYARARGLLLSAMCNDFSSLDFVVGTVDPDMLMIHPSCVCDEEFLRAMARVDKPMVIYVGGLRLSEVENAIAWAREEGNFDLILQYGFQAYPTQIPDNKIRWLQTLKTLFGLPVSFGDHTDGDDPMALVLPLLGIAAGANVVEKHLTFDRVLKGEDFEAALNPDEFKLMVERIRLTEAALGSSEWQPLSAPQLRYRSVVRKRAVAADAITAGTPITRDNIVFKRSDVGLYPEELEHLYGRPAAVELQEDDAITWDVVD